MYTESRKEANRRWYLKHHQENLERSREKYKNNKEKHAECVRRWQEKNKNRIKKKRKKYLTRNAERIRKRSREYRNKNKDKENAQKRLWWQKNKEKIAIKRCARRLQKQISDILSESESFRREFYARIWLEEKIRLLAIKKSNDSWMKRKYATNRFIFKGKHPWQWVSGLDKFRIDQKLYGQFDV